jgi:hypothetical protein
VLQYDDAAIDSSMVWQVLSERGLVPRDHADLIALASPSSMVAIDGHAIHPALRELHFKVRCGFQLTCVARYLLDNCFRVNFRRLILPFY